MISVHRLWIAAQSVRLVGGLVRGDWGSEEEKNINFVLDDFGDDIFADRGRLVWFWGV